MTERQLLSLKNLVGQIQGGLERSYSRLAVVEEILTEQLFQVRAGADTGKEQE